ncbi:MAG: APC family permease, partial [Candidatus Omnitrophica bacterium]|nr:APC family permease [Candidatus Omnitrophota bacterium]
VTALYLLVNAAFLYALGYAGLASSKAVGVDAVAGTLPNLAGVFISALICISALGAVNGLVFTGARISYAVGVDHRLFRLLGRWHPRWGTPAAALVLQGAIAVALIVLLGSFINAILYTAAVVYSFYLATTLAVLVLRRKEPHIERPYRVIGYPVTPLVFAAACLLLIRSAIVHKPWIALSSCLLLLLGYPVWRLSTQISCPAPRPSQRIES